MRLRHPDGQTVHLATVISGENVTGLPGLLRKLDVIAVPERQRLAVDTLSISLRIGPALAAALAASPGMRRRLREELANRGLEVITLDTGDDATPAGRVWRAWCTYTLDLARVLVDLLPEDSVHGSVSTTLPDFGNDEEEEWELAARLLDDLGEGLTEIAWHTGRLVRAAIEPAAPTLITDAEDTAHLLVHANSARIGVCLNPRQSAQIGETPAQALAILRRARLSVVKVRLGAGPEAAGQVGGTQATLAALLGGARARCDHFEVSGAEELDAALDELSVLGLDGAADRPLPGVGRTG